MVDVSPGWSLSVHLNFPSIFSTYSVPQMKTELLTLPGWPWTHGNLPASVCRVLRLQPERSCLADLGQTLGALFSSFVKCAQFSKHPGCIPPSLWSTQHTASQISLL